MKDREYFALYLRTGVEKRHYSQEKYSFLEYLGDLGGLFDVLFLFGLGVTGFLSSKIFVAALINKVYKVQDYYKDFTQYYQTQYNMMITSEESNSEDSLLSDLE